MTFCRESTCWFSSLILSSLAVWLTWTFLLLFSSELFTSGLFCEAVLNGFSFNTKKHTRRHLCLYQVMPGIFHINVNTIINVTVLHKCSSNCLFPDVDFSRLPICWSAGRSSDDPSNQSVCTTCEYMRLSCFCDKDDVMCSCVVYYAPGVSFSMKRLLSSVIPNILIQESMIFPTVVSFGVLRWTIRSDAAACTTRQFRRSIKRLIYSHIVSIMNIEATSTPFTLHLFSLIYFLYGVSVMCIYLTFKTIDWLTVNSDLYQLTIPLYHVVLAVVSVVKK